MQLIAWTITLPLLFILSMIFLLVLLRSRDNAEDAAVVAKRGYAPRGKLFALLLIAGGLITLTTLLPWPHGSARSQVDRVVDATARQWNWSLSETTARVGEQVEFRVTSEDVNHGFALYDPNMRLVNQIQAMPGYTNRLRHTFELPGEYRILCLEYCGLAHHAMTASFTILPADAQQ